MRPFSNTIESHLSIRSRCSESGDELTRYGSRSLERPKIFDGHRWLGGPSASFRKKMTGIHMVKMVMRSGAFGFAGFAQLKTPANAKQGPQANAKNIADHRDEPSLNRISSHQIFPTIATSPIQAKPM
jgi:hypothetical protein